MPLLNVSQVLCSPMLAERFQVRRRTSVVGANGRGAHSDQLFARVYGVCTPDGDNTQEREPNYATGRKSLSVITRFKLQDQVRFAIPDVVLWGGDEYLVESVEDMSHFGSGFIEATCTSQGLQDTEPGVK